MVLFDLLSVVVPCVIGIAVMHASHQVCGRLVHMHSMLQDQTMHVVQ